ncbi:carboxypeptidase-like regulatory domain-containing protein [Roseivirga sp.]|uniref:carboxypeptidase-like regulatory domain-containing protein n=1 Tax=Roseivirga sp. TaxID=1964215 RepID=UPI002B27A65B|nr:carboxypeptidase-like regulatory domain-containing protein [Roseivirga sp.]
MFKTITIVCMLFLCFCLSAQQQENYVLKGQLVEKTTLMPVQFATVLVVNRKQGVATDNEGRFEFPVQLNDSIKITSIGYEPVTFTITAYLMDTHPDGLFIQLEEGTYLLDSVVVTAFAKDFYLNRPERVPMDLGFVDPNAPKTDWSKPQLETLEQGGVGVSGLLNFLDRKFMEKRKLNVLLAAQEKEKTQKEAVEAKFNKEFVKFVTRIDDRVIDEFMEFCNFYDIEVLRASEYQLAQKVLNRYDAFLKR